MNEQKGELDLRSRKTADIVAEEILKNDDRYDRRYLIFILIFIVLLTFLVSSVSFAILSSTSSGTANTISSGSVSFSFVEGENYINIVDAYPTGDSEGKTYTGDGKYFDFSISTAYNSSNSEKLSYDILLLPLSDNTLDSKYIRVYLTDKSNDVYSDVIIKNNSINNFSDLDTTSYSDNGNVYDNAKVLYTKKVDNSMTNTYRLRLWLSDSYELSDESLVFKCKVAVRTYASQKG